MISEEDRELIKAIGNRLLRFLILSAIIIFGAVLFGIVKLNL